MEICQVIKENRKKRELTQEDLAKKLNVSRSTISSWENGRSYPDLEMLLILSKEFEISVDALLKGDSEIVYEISKDTKIRKRNRFIILGLTILILLFGFIIFNSQFKVKDIKQSDIISVEKKKNTMIITLKKSLFYKNVAYEISNSDDDKDAYLVIDRVFCLFGKDHNIIKIDPEFLNDIKDKPIKIVNDRFKPIYEVKK